MLKRDKETPEDPRDPLNFTKFFAEHLCVIASEKTTSTTTILGSMSVLVQLLSYEFS